MMRGQGNWGIPNAEDIDARGLVLLGCGKMGSAMLAGWLARGVQPTTVHVVDPNPSDWLRGTGVQINAGLPPAPRRFAVLAVKPQMMGRGPFAAVWRPLGDGDTLLFVHRCRATTLGQFLPMPWGTQSPIIRAMPTPPAAVGAGSSYRDDRQLRRSQRRPIWNRRKQLLSAIGAVVRR